MVNIVRRETVLAVHGEFDDKPVTATISNRTGQAKRVRFDELTPMAASMPVHMTPKEIHDGDFIMWLDLNGHVTIW